MVETDKYYYYYYYATNSELPMAASGHDTKVTPVTTAEYGLFKAVRPFNSRLDKSKLEVKGFKPLPTWPDAVSRYLVILKKQGFFDELGK